jgi:hypothetical protein
MATANPNRAMVATVASIGGFPSVRAEQFKNEFVPNWSA